MKSGTLHTSIGKKADKMSFIKYIADENHYKEVLSLVGKAKQTVRIGKFFASSSINAVRIVAAENIVQTQ